MASKTLQISPNLPAVSKSNKEHKHLGREAVFAKPPRQTPLWCSAPWWILDGPHNTSLPPLLWVQAGESLPWAAVGKTRQQLPQEFWVGQVGKALVPGGFRSESLAQSDPDLWARLVEIGLVDPPRVWAARGNRLVLPSAITELEPLLSCCFAYWG